MRFRKTSLFFILLMLCSLSLFGCSLEESFTAKNDKDTESSDRFARAFLETLKEGDMEALSALSTEGLMAPEAREMLEATIGYMDHGEVVSIETVKSRIFKEYFSKKTQTLMGYQIELAEAWLKAVVVVDSIEGVQKASALYVEPLKAPMAELYTFDIFNAPTGNYIVLAIAVCVPAFIIYSLSVCLRVKRGLIRYKILWMFFILVGVGTFNFDWSSGQIGFKLFSALLMGSGAYKDTLYGPWVLSFSFPLGAVVFLMYLNKLIEKQKASGGAEKPATAGALKK